jgi:hypothetical protein
MQSIATLSEFADHLRDLIRTTPPAESSWTNELFGELALKLFALQCRHNEPYRTLCEAKGIVESRKIRDWRDIPAIPATAFKDFDLTSLAPENRTSVFHSSGTTEHRPSRHFHNAESLALYEESLLAWFKSHLQFEQRVPIISLTPSRAAAPHSSLVYMFESIREKFGSDSSALVGRADQNGGWTVNAEAAVGMLRRSVEADEPILILGTAFSYVHLLDYLADHDINFKLPNDSYAMETGGYKGRSRNLPKDELHQLICERLGIPPTNIICEYGMSELSSQAYDQPSTYHRSRTSRREEAHSNLRDRNQSLLTSAATMLALEKECGRPRVFHFPPWARVQIISPETGREVNEGETGLIRIYDLANVFSVMAIQTEDLGVRRGDGFELIGRATLAEPRGCSLMTA